MTPTVVETLAAAEQHLRAGQLTGAESLCRSIVQSLPSDPQGKARQPLLARAHRLLGLAVYLGGQPGEALNSVERALLLDPYEAVAHDNRSLYFAALARPVEAEAAARQALAFEPTLPSALFNLGIALSAQRRVQEADIALCQAIVQEPYDPNIWNALGVVRQQLGRLSEAEDAFRRAMDLRQQRSAAQQDPITPLPNERTMSPDTLPTHAVRLNISLAGAQVSLLVPEGETWRVKEIFLENEYRIPSTLVRNPMIVADLGANGGLFAVYAKLMYSRSAVIHCFEPCPAVVSLLRDNVARFQDVHIHPFAVSNFDGETKLHLNRANTGANTIKHDQLGDYPSSIPVEVRDTGRVFDALDLREIDVLKIDTEGSELDILESLGARLKNVRCILAEYHSRPHRRRIDALLADFELFELQPWPSLNGGIVKYVRSDLINQSGK